MIALVFLAMAAAGPTPGTLIERVVAVVDRQVLTLVDVKQAARLETAYRAGPLATTMPLPVDLLEDFRRRLIHEGLLLAEALRFAPTAPAETDVDQAVVKLRQHFPDASSFQSFLHVAALSTDRLRDTLRKSLRIERFLDARIRSRIELTDGDVAAYRAAHSGLESLPDEVVRQRMLNQEFSRRTLTYVAELVERAEIRVIGPMSD